MRCFALGIIYACALPLFLLPVQIVLFIVGGATYEEAMKVAAFNAIPGNPQVILGGTSTLNSKT